MPDSRISLCFSSSSLFLLLLYLEQKCTIDVRQNTSERNRRANESVKLFVATDRKLQMTWRDALDFQVLGSIACELEYFGGKVFQHGCEVDGGFSTDTRLVAGDGSKVALYATAGELNTRT